MGHVLLSLSFPWSSKPNQILWQLRQACFKVGQNAGWQIGFWFDLACDKLTIFVVSLVGCKELAFVLLAQIGITYILQWLFRARTRLATTTQIFDVVSTSSEIDCMLTNATVYTWRQKKNALLSSSANGPLIHYSQYQNETWFSLDESKNWN